MIDIGVASPSAQGQAMISTETAASRAKAKRGSGPQTNQAAKAANAITTTSGTNQLDTLSASRWMGARLRCASATILTMRDSMVSAPTFSAFITKVPVRLTVPPTTLASGSLVTGMGSPVIEDSSTALLPSVTTPSTGTFSPGRTRRRSPATIASIGTSASLPSAPTLSAVRGRQAQQRLDGAAGRIAGAQFEHLADQHQAGDDGGRLEIDRDRAILQERGGEQAGCQRWLRRCRPTPCRCRARSG